MADLVKVNDADTPLVTLTAAAAGGDQFLNNGNSYLVVDNAGVSTDVTFTAQRTTLEKEGFGKITLADKVVTVAGGTRSHITAPPSIYNDGNGKVQVTYTSVSSVTVQARERTPD